MKLIRILFTIYLLVIPQVAAAQPSREQVRHDSVVKLKENLKKEQRNLAVKGGITNWSPATDDIDAQPNGFTMLKGLGICVGIFFIGIAITQRLRNRRGIIKGQARQMRVIERLQLTPKTALLLVECEGRKLMLTVGNERVSFSPDQNENKDSSIPEFSEVYAQQEERLSA